MYHNLKIDARKMIYLILLSEIQMNKNTGIIILGG